MSLVGLYRVQNANGEGPYSASKYCPRSKYENEVYNKHLARHDASPKHPAACRDLGRWMLSDERCAFADLKSLHAWFQPDELAAMARFGFTIHRVWVDSDTVTAGKFQVVYPHPESRILA